MLGCKKYARNLNRKIIYIVSYDYYHEVCSMDLYPSNLNSGLFTQLVIASQSVINMKSRMY